MHNSEEMFLHISVLDYWMLDWEWLCFGSECITISTTNFFLLSRSGRVSSRFGWRSWICRGDNFGGDHVANSMRKAPLPGNRCSIARCGAVWCGVVWYDKVRCGAVCCDNNNSDNNSNNNNSSKSIISRLDLFWAGSKLSLIHWHGIITNLLSLTFVIFYFLQNLTVNPKLPSVGLCT